jgi:putative ABC transport system permease protein
MYLFTRAFAYIRKQAAKTFLLLVLFLVIGNIVLAGLSVQYAANAAKTLTRQEIGTDITYTLNNQQVRSDTQKGVIETTASVSTLSGAPTYANLLKIVNSDYVATVDAIATYEVTSDTLTPYTYVSTNTDTGDGPGMGRPGDFVPGSYTSSGDFSFKTFTTVSPTDFTSETSTLTSGRLATQTEIDSGALVAIIEKTLADSNALKVGDTLALTPTMSGFTTTPITYTIIGIYTTSSTIDDRMARMIGSSLLPQNQIYTPLLSLKTIGYTSEQLDATVLSSAVIKLKDPANLSLFKTEAASKVTLTYGILDANDRLYNQLAGPIESLGSVSTTLVWIVAIAGAAILALITALTVNQRKNEIGILLAVGESKLRIIAQFVVEVAAIAVVAFTLSIFTGTYIGKYISQQTLSNYGTSEIENQGGPRIPGSGLPTQNNPTNITTPSIDVSLNGIVLIELFAAGLLITIVSVIIPALYVTRFNPKQILTNNG